MTRRIVLVSSLLALAVPALAHGNERGEAKAVVAGKAVSIDYGRPSLQGRDMLGRAEVGQPWRMGADAATTLKTDADLRFGDAAVPKGEYVLTATKLAEGRWQLNLLTNTKEKAKVADVPLVGEKLKEPVEILTIDLEGGNDKGEFRMSWGDTALKAAFTAK
jgi:hypothetical protein